MATNKKEAFRQYLEAAGVLDTITKSEALYHSLDIAASLSCKLSACAFAVLVSLYEEPERPKNALE